MLCKFRWPGLSRPPFDRRTDRGPAAAVIRDPYGYCSLVFRGTFGEHRESLFPLSASCGHNTVLCRQSVLVRRYCRFGLEKGGVLIERGHCIGHPVIVPFSAWSGLRNDVARKFVAVPNCGSEAILR